MLSDDRIAEMMRDTWGCASIAPRHAEAFARSVEAEVRKDYDALIRQMLEALESCYTDDNGEEIEDGFDKKKVEAAKYAARARLLDSDLSNLTERGARRWRAALVGRAGCVIGRPVVAGRQCQGSD